MNTTRNEAPEFVWVVLAVNGAWQPDPAGKRTAEFKAYRCHFVVRAHVRGVGKVGDLFYLAPTFTDMHGEWQERAQAERFARSCGRGEVLEVEPYWCSAACGVVNMGDAMALSSGAL